MAPSTHPSQIGILVYPDSQHSAVLGLTDLLEAADRLRKAKGVSAAGIEVKHWHAKDGLPAPQRPLDALILPPSLGGEPPARMDPALIRWIQQRHKEGTLICSVCAGAFLLAATGLLDGRAATTHWALAEAFARRFPTINLDTDRLLIDDGDLITAGGLMAWVDLGLKLVDRFLGPAIMLTTARFFLVDPGGREQRFYSTFAPHLTHGDAVILKLQHWLQARSAERLTVPMMARRAMVGERTFLRRFNKATGLNPTQYLQLIRVGKARELLESSALAMDEIAWQVGYEDPGAFRKVFMKIMGLSPGEYRRRFGTSR